MKETSIADVLLALVNNLPSIIGALAAALAAFMSYRNGTKIDTGNAQVKEVSSSVEDVHNAIRDHIN